MLSELSQYYHNIITIITMLSEDHAIGLSTFTIMAGLGGSLGYVMGALDWGRLGEYFLHVFWTDNKEWHWTAVAILAMFTQSFFCCDGSLTKGSLVTLFGNFQLPSLAAIFSINFQLPSLAATFGSCSLSSSSSSSAVLASPSLHSGFSIIFTKYSNWTPDDCSNNREVDRWFFGHVERSWS